MILSLLFLRALAAWAVTVIPAVVLGQGQPWVALTEKLSPPSQISMAGCTRSAQLRQGLPSLCLASQYPLISPGTPPALAPSTLELFLRYKVEVRGEVRVESPESDLNMSVVAAAGAVSLATRDREVPLARKTVMTKPPPMPID